MINLFNNKKVVFDFDKQYKLFCDYCINNLSIDDLDYIKLKGANYVSYLFDIYINDINKLCSVVYFDRLNNK